MGASESDLSSVDTLRDQISALETRLSGISQQHQDFEVWPEAKDGRVLTVCGARLQCRSDVTILTGPVIGKVTSTTALVLLETSKTVDVTMFVSLVDLDVPNGRVIASTTQRCVGRKPTTISVSNLLPGESYVVTFSNVSRDSASNRIGQFRTFDLEDRSLRILSVSCDSPDKVLSGEPNMWETLSERVLRKELPHIDLMVHLGGQVSMKKAFEDSWVILKRHSERFDLVPGEWSSIEDEVTERLRTAYRFSWNLPYTREVLASCSHLMVCSDKDIYPNFTLDIDLSTDVGGRVTTTLLRLARKVYREYQRALWDVEDLNKLSEKEEEMVAKVTKVFEARRRRLGREEALSKAEKKMVELRQNQFADEDVVEAAGERLEELRYELDEAKGLEAIAASEIDSVDSRESSYHKYGDVGVLMVDSRWNRVSSDGTQAMSQPLISTEQLLMFEAQIEGNNPPRALVVCSEFPLVEMDRTETINVRCGGEHNLTDFHSSNSTYALNPKVQSKLLEIVFGWKKRERFRQVLLLAGGLCHGLDSVVKIKDTDWAIQQVTTGPLTDRPADVRCKMQGNILDGAYEYNHTPLSHQRNYAEALVRARYGESSTIHAQLVGQYFARVGCICGPIIGKVTNDSAIILIEVDNEAPITCMVADVLSGVVLRITKLLPARRPFAFVFDGLESDRYYVVRYEGFVNADDRMGSFTTGKDYSTDTPADYSLNLVFMSGERGKVGGGGIMSLRTSSAAEEKKDDTPPTSVWGMLTDVSRHPWSGVDAVVHLGGQVDMDTATNAAIALLARAEREDEGSQSQKQLLNDALDHLREAYRTSWSLPGTREALSMGSHIMIRGALDFGNLLMGRKTGVNQPTISGKSKRTLRNLVKQVYREYQRQLWDPEGVADAPMLGCSESGDEENGEWHFHQWGNVGVFCMDVKETRVWKGRSGGKDSDMPLISDKQWECFSDAISVETLGTLVICCEVPFVSDSIGDARYKATDPAHAHLVEHWPYHGSELLRLLNGLFEWQGALPNREVLLLCGGISVGVDSMIKHTSLGRDIRQVITGPAAAECETDLWAERTGVLNDSIVYEHGPVTTVHNCVLLQAIGNGVGGSTYHANVTSPADLYGHIGGRNGLKRLPYFLGVLHTDKKRSGGGDVTMIQSGGSEEEIEEQRFTLNIILLKQVMKREDIRSGLKAAFNQLHSGDSKSFDKPGDFARAAVKVLTRYYYNSPAALKDVALPPNLYLLEVVAKMWEEGTIGLADKSPDEAMPSGKKKTKEEKQAEWDAKKGGGKKYNVPLALLNAEGFVNFVHESFKNALIVRMNLLMKRKSDKLKM